MSARRILLTVLFAALVGHAPAIDLFSGYKQAEELARNAKPHSSSSGDQVRNEREERSSPPRQDSVDTGPTRAQQRDAEKKRQEEAREREKERVQDNLQMLDRGLAGAAIKAPAPPAKLTPAGDDAATIAGRQRAIDGLMKSKNQLAAQRAASTGKAEALRQAQLIRDAALRGERPPFAVLWNQYKYNRPLAMGLVPDTNRCAIVLSLTLGLEPRPSETSLHDLGNKELVNTLVGPLKTLLNKPVQNSEEAKSVYIQAQQLANRLKSDWGNPTYYEGKNARAEIQNKKGVIFFHAASVELRRAGDHIDLWDNGRLGADGSTKPEDAREVWFWEIP